MCSSRSTLVAFPPHPHKTLFTRRWMGYIGGASESRMVAHPKRMARQGLQ